MDFNANDEIIDVNCHLGITSSNNINHVIDKDLPLVWSFMNCIL